MKKVKVSEAGRHLDELLGLIGDGKVAGWTYCNFVVLMKVETITNPDNYEFELIESWIQVPAALVKKAQKNHKDYLKLTGSAFVNGAEIKFIPLSVCKKYPFEKMPTKSDYKIKLVDLFISEIDNARD